MMLNENPTPDRDTCNRMLRNAESPELSERQRRFLEAYQERVSIAPAARLAGVHRATVYRWLADASFVAAMRTAAEAYFRELRAKALGAETDRQRWRDERERERGPMRRHYLEIARAAKRR